MVVAHTAGKSEATTDQEVAHDCLETGLAALEVRAGEEGALDASVLNDSRVEGVLGRAIQVEDLLLDGRDTVEYGGRQLLVRLNAGLQIVEGIDLGEEEHLSVGGPEEDDLVSAGFHLANVLLDLLNKLTVGALHDVVGTITLVSSDVVGVQSSRERSDLLQVLTKLLDERGLKDT